MKRKYTLLSLKKRLLALLLVVALIFLTLFCRLFYVQIIDGTNLSARALDQWTRDLPITAARGIIYDTNGIILAGNRASYSLFVRPKAVENKQEVAQKISALLELNYDNLYDKISNRSISEVTIKKQLSKETAEIITSYKLAGVYISTDNSRVYSYNDLLSQVLGYVSIDNIGQTGLEQLYNKYLKGIDGKLLTQADLQGIEIEGGKCYYIPPIDGLDISLTIDYNIQSFAENAMENAMRTYNPIAARAIVMDPNTGAVLAMANKPSLDLNNLPRDDIAMLNSYSRNSLVIDIYEPGSTFKIFTAAANIEEYNKGNKNAFSDSYIFNSSKNRIVDGQKIKCWNDHLKGKHSNQTLSDALNNSCNPCFVDIALSLGTNKMYDYIEAFGFGKETGIDFIGESSGMVLAKSLVKNCDLARIGFGQTIAVTPLQLLASTCAAINGGKYAAPYLVKDIKDKNGTLAQTFYPQTVRRVISQNTSSTINTMLEDVVTNGSGKNAYIQGYKVAGKTGTAQKYANGLVAQGKYVSSFVGYFPADKPQYACLIVIDEPIGQGYGSVVAAPYAKQIFEQIISYKNLKPFV